MVTVLPKRAVTLCNTCLPLGSQLAGGLRGARSGPWVRGQEAAHATSPRLCRGSGGPTGVTEHG